MIFVIPIILIYMYYCLDKKGGKNMIIAIPILLILCIIVYIISGFGGDN